MTSWLQLDPTDPIPLYEQISRQVRRLVALGALRSGDRLPTVRELAAKVRVNRNTAARAIQQLESEGIVRTRVGQGTFVADGAAGVGHEQRARLVDDALDAVLVEARTVGFPLDELSARLQRRLERFRQAMDSRGPEDDA